MFLVKQDMLIKKKTIFILMKYSSEKELGRNLNKSFGEINSETVGTTF